MCLRSKRALATDAIDDPVPSCCHQPHAGVGGCPAARPALGSYREGLLSGFLGEIEVAGEADQ
jgi:hypothetical protein